MASSPQPLRRQFNVRVDTVAARAARRYAQQHGVRVSQLVEVLLQDLQQQVEQGGRPFSAVLRELRARTAGRSRPC